MGILELQQQADAQLACNDVQAANKTLLELSQLQPTDMKVLNQLAWTFLTIGDSQNAILVCEKMLSIFPKATDANYYLGLIYGQKGEMKKVREYFSRVLEVDPRHLMALIKLAYIDYLEGKTVSTLALLLRAKKIEPNNVELNIRFGRLYTAMNEFNKAKKHYNLALKIEPKNTEAIAQLASLHAYSGDSGKALSMLQPYLDKGKIDVAMAIVLAEICRSIKRCDDAKMYLEKILKTDLDHLGKSSILFALGKLYDRDNEFDKAFKAYHQANKLNDFSFDLWDEHNTVMAIRERMGSSVINALPTAKKSGKQLKPIFIVGMPRSGTSLVEQILSSHPLVHGAGERMEISTIASSIQELLNSGNRYPFCLSEIAPSQLTAKSKRYLKDISRQIPSNKRFITDKMPDNYKHLALIYQMFPNAKVIHCVRDARDNCLSCYFTQLMGHGYSYDLKTLGSHYNLYEAVMKHWQNVLPLSILDVQYEDMVQDAEKVSRKIIEFCGLEWTNSCLDFHETKRNVVTASSDQVRQPIYSKSVARWEHYKEHINELTEILEKTV